MKGRPMMSNMRYRKPSVSSLLGITRLKKRVKKALGINKLLWPFRAVNNYQRRVLRRAGYYNPELKMMRAVKRGQVPGPIGPLQVGEGDHDAGGKGLDSNALLVAAMLAKGKGKEEGHKKDSNSPLLAEAMLLASAMKGTEAAHAPHAKHVPDVPTPKAKHAPELVAPSAGSARRKRHAVKPAPKTPLGWRILGMALVALAVAAAIVAVWYYWIV
jgi:hypothetical protein